MAEQISHTDKTTVRLCLARQKQKTMKYTRHLSTIGFYPHVNWFYYYRGFKYIDGFVIRILGIELMVKESNSLTKLTAKAFEQNQQRKTI